MTVTAGFIQGGSATAGRCGTRNDSKARGNEEPSPLYTRVVGVKLSPGCSGCAPLAEHDRENGRTVDQIAPRQPLGSEASRCSHSRPARCIQRGARVLRAGEEFQARADAQAEPRRPPGRRIASASISWRGEPTARNTKRAGCATRTPRRPAWRRDRARSPSAGRGGTAARARTPR